MKYPDLIFMLVLVAMTGSTSSTDGQAKKKEVSVQLPVEYRLIA